MTATRSRSDTARAREQARNPRNPREAREAGETREALDAVLETETRRRGKDPSATNRAKERRTKEWMAEGVAGTVARARQDVRATVYRQRRQLLPHAATAAVLGAGLGVDAVVAAGASPATAATVAAGAASLVGVWLSQRVRRRRPAWARRAQAAALGAVGWLAFAPAGGIGAGDVAVLTGLEMAVAARWWQSCRIGYPDNDQDGQDGQGGEAVEPLATPEQFMADWDQHVARKGGPAPGSRLIDEEETAHGWKFTLELAPAEQTYPQILGVLPKMASGLDVGIAALVLEKHPGHESPRWCTLQVILNSPIAGNVDFDGPRRLNAFDGKPGYGLLQLGPYADGSGEAIYRLYTPGSMWSGVIIGATGIGKSRVVENVVISALSSGDTEYWYIDPNRGASSPALFRHADWPANADEADDVLAALLAVLDARADENAVMDWMEFTPSPARPGLLVVIEECHRIFTRETAPLWARVAREGRKLGVAILALSQYAGLETFGGNEALRSSIMAGNALVMHVSSNSAKNLMPGLEVDPKTLPRIPGYGYTLATPEGGGRTAPFRNRNTAPGGDAGVAEQWLAAQPRPGLDTLTATATLAAGTAYRDRHATTDTGRAASTRRVQELRAGILPADFLPGHGTDRPHHGGQAGGTTPAATTYGKIITFPTFAEHLQTTQTAPTAPTGPAAEPAAGRGRPDHLSPSHQAVWDAVAAGATRPAQVVEHVGLSRRQVQDLLKDLVETGYLTQPKYGHYQAA